MTYEEAARLIDPATSREALLPYAYDPQYQQMLLRDACQMAAEVLRGVTGICVESKWISVEDDMPKEHDSIFKKFKGTKKWLNGMFETISDTVIVSVKFENGTRKTFPAHTADGKWRRLPEIRNHKVTHWMPMPEPPKMD